jgi:hypothetical protein
MTLGLQQFQVRIPWNTGPIFIRLNFLNIQGKVSKRFSQRKHSKSTDTQFEVIKRLLKTTSSQEKAALGIIVKRMKDVMKIQVSLKATKLKNVAGAFKGKSDPFAVVTLLGANRGDKPKIIGKTEVIKNTLEPDWVATFRVDYELGKPANLLVKIFDKVSKGDNIPMGSAVFDVGNVMGAKGNSKGKKMNGGRGTIFCKVQKAEDSGTLRLKMSGDTLKNTEGLFGKSDPFFEILKKDYGLRGSEWNVVHRSSYIKNDLNPNWPIEDIDLGVLCDDDLDANLVFRVYDHESDGNHVLMGEFESSVNGLENAKSSGFELRRRGKPKGKIVIHTAEVSGVGGNPRATALVPDIPIEEMKNVIISPSAPPLPSAPLSSGKPSFAEYISGGCEINLCVAIDFTGSNGDPRKPGTLHYIHRDGQRNDYQKAIGSIGSILQHYDSDKKFPVYGFGAKYGGEVQHAFQCGPTEEVDGVEGILNAYKQTFSSGLVMSGPTVITEVIQIAAARANSSQEAAAKEGKQKYTVLLILTDGAVSDVAATARCLDAVSQCPLSVVIVGVGDADFSGMRFLDDNNGEPDIAQFVEFNAHKNNSNSLTAATLDEIPRQLSNFYASRNILPNPQVDIEEEEIVVQPEEEEFDLTLDFGDDGDIVVGSGDGVYVPPGAY